MFIVTWSDSRKSYKCVADNSDTVQRLYTFLKRDTIDKNIVHVYYNGLELDPEKGLAPIGN